MDFTFIIILLAVVLAVAALVVVVSQMRKASDSMRIGSGAHPPTFMDDRGDAYNPVHMMTGTDNSPPLGDNEAGHGFSHAVETVVDAVHDAVSDSGGDSGGGDSGGGGDGGGGGD